MQLISKPAQGSVSGPGPCFVREVADVFAVEPRLEAVTLDRAAKSIQVATLGGALDSDLGAKISERVQMSERNASDGECGFLLDAKRCENCERRASLDPRAFSITNSGSATTISRASCPTAPKFWRWRNIPWPSFVPREVEIPDSHDFEREWKRQMVAAVICGASGLAGAYPGFGEAFRIGAFAISFLAGSWYAAEEVWELLCQRKLDVHFLMLAVAFGGAAIGAYGEGATLLFLFSFSSALEHYAMGRTQREISSLFKNAPKVALVVNEQDEEIETPVELLVSGMRLIVKPDSQFPVDGEILKGETACDESTLTGESIAVEKRLGDAVLAGTMNLWGAVVLQVSRPAAESALQRIIHLIRESQRSKAPAQRFTDRFGSRYTCGILTLSGLMFFFWWLGRGLPPFSGNEQHPSAFYNSMVLLVVASPCALVLSIPSAVLAAIAWGARRGILFRGGAAVEKLASVDVVALDKTGTLTTGELRVEKIESFPPGREMEVEALAYSLEKMSQHPLARAMSLHGRRRGIVALDLTEFSSVTGSGLMAADKKERVLLGKRAWVAELARSSVLGAAPASAPGSSEVWLVRGNLAGRILFRDEIRPQSKPVLDALRAAGMRSVVLTGDRPEAAALLQESLQPDEILAGLKPEQKVAAIRSLTQEGRRVAMVGDGVNDAPSLAAAYVGIAMGARGSDAAMEQADVVLMHDRLENFWEAFVLSQRARAIIRQNVAISLGTVGVLVFLAMASLIPLTIGVIGHEGSTVVVVMNSLRLLFSRGAFTARAVG